MFQNGKLFVKILRVAETEPVSGIWEFFLIWTFQ